MPRGRHTANTGFWGRLQEAAEQRGYPTTQVAIAKLAGVNQTSARKWAMGGLPDLDRTVRIAHKLGVCVEWLITGRGPIQPNKPTDPDLTKLLELWAHMDAQRREELLGAAVYLRTISRSRSPSKQ